MENKNFTKADFKVGYVVETAAGVMHMVVPYYTTGKLALIDDNSYWCELDSFTDDLRDPHPNIGKDLTITAVYGYSKYATFSLEISTRARDILWVRETPAKKMTVKEIAEALGYPVEIIEG